MATNDDHEFVAFRVGSQEFCVDIMCVREIRGWTAATPLPHAPDFVRGVINLRGAVLPIVDLASRFGLPDTEPTPRSVIIVVQINKQVVGLLVDAVSDIFTTNGASWQATPEIASDVVKSMVGGIYALEGRMISLVILNSIIPTAEKVAA
ncbi:MAG TPA: chemotaxis protein CheW [Hyphomicrobium sp.]|nr:chemotaxis protein CheW [Hyphomicrobium sp.]